MQTIRRSEIDGEGVRASVAVLFGGEEGTCPIVALRRRLETAAIGAGKRQSRFDHGDEIAAYARAPGSGIS